MLNVEVAQWIIVTPPRPPPPPPPPPGHTSDHLPAPHRMHLTARGNNTASRAWNLTKLRGSPQRANVERSSQHIDRTPNAGLLLGQHHRRWANIKPTLDQLQVFDGEFLPFEHTFIRQAASHPLSYHRKLTW